MIENWLPILGYETEYQVSNLGNVRSVERMVPNTATSTRLMKSQAMRPFPHRNGYLCVKLAKNNKKTNYYVHRLVATAFVSGQGDEVCHSDGDKTNNCAINLSWGSRADNMADRHRLGENAVGERHGMHKLKALQVLAIRNDSRPNTKIAIDYGVSTSTISMIKSRAIWKSLHG